MSVVDRNTMIMDTANLLYYSKSKILEINSDQYLIHSLDQNIGLDYSILKK